MKSSLILLFIIIAIALIGCSQDNEELLTLKEEIKMKTEIGERNKQSVLNFLMAIENKNVDDIADLFSEDGVHINPYASGIFPEGTKGKDGVRDYWEPVFPNFEKLEFPVDEIYAMEDPTMIFIKFKGKIKLLNDSGYYDNDYYATFKFNEKGEIIEYVEIFNPIVAARGFELLDKIK